MKPIYLSIEGINSFTSAQEINFSEAADGNIFCICGPTGSGKTTILDAVILALYGSGDRGVKDDYINLSCDKGSIVFRFELGGAEWEVKRILSRKAGGDKAYLFGSNGDMVADGIEKVNAEMQKLIGLSRADFTQVVILEQGKFGKFLTATKTERNKTIAQLFSLDKFDGLQSRFNSVAAEFESLENETAAKAEHLQAFTAEALKEKKAELKDREKRLAETTAELRKLEKEIADNVLLRQKFENLKAAKKGLEDSERALDIEKQVEKELEVKRAIAEESENNAQKAKSELEKAKDILSKSESAKSSKEHIEKLENKRGELRVKYAAKEKERKEAEEKAALKNAEKEKLLAESKELFGDFAGKSTDEASERFNALKSSLGADLSADKISAENYKKSLENLQRLRSKFVEADAKIPVLRLDLERAEQAENEASEILEKMRLENTAQSIAHSLKDGDKCPVCGGVFRVGSDLSVGDAALSVPQTDPCVPQTMAEVVGDAALSVPQNASQLKTAEENAKALSKKREQSAAELKMVCADRDRLLSDMNAAEKQTAEALGKIKCTQTADEINSELLKLEKEYNNACAAVEALKKISSAEKEKDTFAEAELRLKTDTELILQEGKSLAEEIARRETDIKNMFGGEDFAVAEKRARETCERCDKTIREAERLKDELNKLTGEHGVRLAKITANIENYKKAVESAGEVAFDEKAAEEAAIKKESADKRKEELISSVSELKNYIAAAEEGLKEKAALEEKRKYYEKKRDTAKTLSTLLRGNKFLEFIEEEYIREFTSAASEKLFELSGGKFNLEYIEDEKKSDFWVKDHLRGGEMRKVKTLSGGETFLASLSMAIAISEQIAHSRSYDFFFLDEGFGTLDENAIDTVAAALYSLASQTMVGLVSHRSELVEKIPSRIKVTPATETAGSKISIERA